MIASCFKVRLFMTSDLIFGLNVCVTFDPAAVRSIINLILEAPHIFLYVGSCGWHGNVLKEQLRASHWQP